MTVTSSLDVYRGGGDRDDKEDMDDVDDDNESRFLRQDLSGIGLVTFVDGGGILARLDDIKRITSSSGSMAGRGTLLSFGARGVPEPAEAFDFFKDMIIRKSSREKNEIRGMRQLDGREGLRRRTRSCER